MMTTLVSLMKSEKQVRLERLSRVFPCLITAESRRRKLQRFLDLPHESDRINLVSINYLLQYFGQFWNRDAPRAELKKLLVS